MNTGLRLITAALRERELTWDQRGGQECVCVCVWHQQGNWL